MGGILSFSVLFLLLDLCNGAELLRNGDFESMDGWGCHGFQCQLTTDHYCGSHSIKVTHRTDDEGPIQTFNAISNHMYSAKARVKLLSDAPGKLGQEFEIVVDYLNNDGRHSYAGVAQHPLARTSDGWILLQGDFKAPSYAVRQTRVRIRGPDPSIGFLVDCASITNIWYGDGWRAPTDQVIHDVRQSNINLHVRTSGGVDYRDVEVQVLQTKKAFPIGTVVNAWKYDDDSKQLYRDFIHQHFNWAVSESSLKWPHVEGRQGRANFGLPLRMLDGLRQHGLKVRGHNLMSSKPDMVPDWLKPLSRDAVRAAIDRHVRLTMNMTRGKVEHWDVNNENLHGFWFQEKLDDFGFEETPFRLAHSIDPSVKLFLNDYNIVAHGASTGAYVEQAERLKQANVGLYGLGVQCHFYVEEEPDPYLIKTRLDKLAETGLPVWVTEFNVVAENEDTRADYIETAMRAFFGHPAVEGILLWGFWDQSHSRGPHAALVKGDHLQLTAAGRRFLDLWENQWMTDVTRDLDQADSRLTVRGFHGDYQVRVHYEGRELRDLRQTFTLGQSAKSLNVNVHQ